MAKKMELTKNFWITWIIIFLILTVLAAVCFGVFANREEEVIVQEENGGNVILNYSGDFPGIKLENAEATTDAVGMKKSEDKDYYDFSVESTLDNATSIEYDLSIVRDKENSTIPDDEIRIYLEEEKSGTYTAVFEPKAYEALKEDNEFGTKSGSMVLAHVKKTKSTVDHYRLRIWLNDKSVMTNGTYRVEIVVNGISQ